MINSYSRQEAILLMKQGVKMTHVNFSDNEWITIQGNKIFTEEGYKHDTVMFWYYRAGKAFNDGWLKFKQ